jgi:hypothetical protein
LYDGGRNNQGEGFWATSAAPIYNDCYNGPVHPTYNLSFSAYFLNWNNVFLLQQISQQYFSADLSAQLNGANMWRDFVDASIEQCHIIGMPIGLLMK